MRYALAIQQTFNDWPDHVIEERREVFHDVPNDDQRNANCGVAVSFTLRFSTPRAKSLQGKRPCGNCRQDGRIARK